MTTSQVRVEPTQVAPQLYAALDLLHKDAVKIDQDVLAVDANIRTFRTEQEKNFDATNVNIEKGNATLVSINGKLTDSNVKLTESNVKLDALQETLETSRQHLSNIQTNTGDIEIALATMTAVLNKIEVNTRK